MTRKKMILWIFAAASALFVAGVVLTPVLAVEPAPLKVLHTFDTAGTPANIVEVAPGRFLGIVQASQGIFSITSGGSYQYLYGFPRRNSGLAVLGLTPGLNGQVYGAALSPGPVTTFSEFFSVTPDGKVTTHAYDSAAQGAPVQMAVQSSDGSLYAFFESASGLTSTGWTQTACRLCSTHFRKVKAIWRPRHFWVWMAHSMA